MNLCSISVRVSGKDKLLIENVCTMRGEDISDFVRRSLKLELARLGYLSEEEQQALGI